MFLILLTIVFVLVYTYLTRNLDYWEKRGVKYEKPLPLVGNMLSQIKKSKTSYEFLEGLYENFPNERYFGIFQFTTPILVLKDLELIKRVAIKNFENFVDHAGFVSEETDPLWGKTLFGSSGYRWRSLRQTLSPAFTSSKMRTMFVLIDECARQWIDFFKQQDQSLIELEMKDVYTRYANDVIASTAFGIDCNSLKNKENEFLMTGRELSNFKGLKRIYPLFCNNFPKLAKFFKLKLVNDKCGDFFRAIINETIAMREQNNIVRPDLINLLMMARKGKLKYEEHAEIPEAGYAAVQESELGKTDKSDLFLTNEDITSQALIFFLGGFESSSSLMSFTSYELAVNQEIQNKLREEIEQVWKEGGGKITYENLLQMKYLDMITSEALRKWTQAVWVDRKCTKPFEIEPIMPGESTVKISVGDVCIIPVHAIHRDPKYYPNPEVFDPERFSDENKHKINPITYLPFGLGPRNCIGSRFALLQTKILFFYLVKEFDIVTTEKTQIPLKISKESFLVIAENGVHLGFKKRL